MKPDTPHPKVVILLLNYRGTDDTIACLESLKQLDYPNFHITVVDNASPDDSVARLRAYDSDLDLIEAPDNLGFSGGNNLGIQKAMADPEVAYLWLLNNDTTVPPETLSQLVQAAQQNPSAVIGPTIRYPDGRFQSVGNKVDLVFGNVKKLPEFRHGGFPVVESLSGCSMLIPMPVFQTVGLWDERYFLYFEDNDFCLRLNHAGWCCRVSPEATVFHQEGATTGRNKPLVTYYYQRNRLLLGKRFASPLLFGIMRGYTAYRLFRSKMKAQRSPEHQAHYEAFKLAVDDFNQGITGKCPHPL